MHKQQIVEPHVRVTLSDNYHVRDYAAPLFPRVSNDTGRLNLYHAACEFKDKIIEYTVSCPTGGVSLANPFASLMTMDITGTTILGGITWNVGTGIRSGDLLVSGNTVGFYYVVGNNVHTLFSTDGTTWGGSGAPFLGSSLIWGIAVPAPDRIYLVREFDEVKTSQPNIIYGHVIVSSFKSGQWRPDTVPVGRVVFPEWSVIAGSSTPSDTFRGERLINAVRVGEFDRLFLTNFIGATLSLAYSDQIPYAQGTSIIQGTGFPGQFDMPMSLETFICDGVNVFQREQIYQPQPIQYQTMSHVARGVSYYCTSRK